MRMTTGEQLREVAAALKQDQRNYLHEVEQLKAQRDELVKALEAELAALKAKAAVPDGWKLVKVGVEGVRFGNAWYSHEKITGYSADQLNAGHCGIAGREYMEWLATAPTQPQSDAVIVPRDVLCRWENELDQIASAMHIADEMAVLLGGEA